MAAATVTVANNMMGIVVVNVMPPDLKAAPCPRCAASRFKPSLTALANKLPVQILPSSFCQGVMGKKLSEVG